MYQVVFYFLKTRYETEGALRKTHGFKDRPDLLHNAIAALEQKYESLRDSLVKLQNELDKKHEYGDVGIVKELMKSCGDLMDEVRHTLGVVSRKT